jgi:hypothetical protein
LTADRAHAVALFAVIVSSDPHAFLRPIYRKLAGDRAFHVIHINSIG